MRERITDAVIHTERTQMARISRERPEATLQWTLEKWI